MPITIDVVQDTVCPWCRIGKKNLDDALKNFDGEPEVRFHPFFLRPEMPEAGRDFREHMRSIKGDDDFGPMLLRVSNIGLQAGLTFNWDRVRRMPNTLLSHAFVPLGAGGGAGRGIDAVHRAYFVEGPRYRQEGDADRDRRGLAGRYQASWTMRRSWMRSPGGRKRPKRRASPAFPSSSSTRNRASPAPNPPASSWKPWKRRAANVCRGIRPYSRQPVNDADR